MSEVAYRRIGSPVLKTPVKTLKGPAQHSLEALGQFQGTLKYKTRSSTQTIYVVKGLQNSLLGLPAITSLNFGSTNRHVKGRRTNLDK